MMKLGFVSLPVVVLLVWFAPSAKGAEPTNTAPEFSEVYGLIREHLVGFNEAELNRAAVQGLLSVIGPKVSLVEASEAVSSQAPLLVTKSSIFEGSIGYIRVSRVAEGLDQAVQKAWQEFRATNRLNGIVIDLRYATGTDYAAATATADRFTRKEQPLLDWGNGMVRSKEKSDNISLPMGVLVNQRTAGAAEALAALFREVGSGLILGNHTAGQAMIAQEYPLKNGQRLRIATAPIQLGDGTTLSEQGIKPDITVEVAAADERLYYDDPFRELGRGSTGTLTSTAGSNRARRLRFNEAELVRERRDGSISDADGGGNDSEKPVVRDPPLARALDFLKGLSVMRQTRS